jgi:hypothetical protein
MCPEACTQTTAGNSLFSRVWDVCDYMADRRAYAVCGNMGGPPKYLTYDVGTLSEDGLSYTDYSVDQCLAEQELYLQPDKKKDGALTPKYYAFTSGKGCDDASDAIRFYDPSTYFSDRGPEYDELLPSGILNSTGARGPAAESISTLAECSAAAKALGLDDNTAQDDGQSEKASDPPFCYSENGKLKLNGLGDNTGECSEKDMCICKAVQEAYCPVYSRRYSTPYTYTYTNTYTYGGGYTYDTFSWVENYDSNQCYSSLKMLGADVDHCLDSEPSSGTYPFYDLDGYDHYNELDGYGFCRYTSTAGPGEFRTNAAFQPKDEPNYLCVDSHDEGEVLKACLDECDRTNCACVAVTSADAGVNMAVGGDCPKGRCAIAFEPAEYTVASWGGNNYELIGYKAYNNNKVNGPPPEYEALPGLGFCRMEETCTDTDNGAKDNGGYGCADYTPEYCGTAYDVVGDGKDVLTFTANEMCCVCKDLIYKSKVTESVCVDDANDMQEAITKCTEKCDEIGCGCVAVSANDPGVPANPDAECPKARCEFAMDPGTYTVGSWGEATFDVPDGVDGRGYKSYNRKDVKSEEPQPEETKPTTKPSKGT